jgi:hypothetical protein
MWAWPIARIIMPRKFAELFRAEVPEYSGPITPQRVFQMGF